MNVYHFPAKFNELRGVREMDLFFSFFVDD